MALDLSKIPIIDCDSHVTEPPDLWTSRVSSKWDPDDVPHLVWDEDAGEMKWLVGGLLTYGVGRFAYAGWKHYPPSHPLTLDDADLAAWDSKARLERMDEYGIQAQLLYANLVSGITQAFHKIKDPALVLETVRVYNDYMVEWSSADPKRLFPVMTIPFWDLDAACKEIERLATYNFAGVLLGADYTLAMPELNLPAIWDPYWYPLLDRINEAGLAVNFHLGHADKTFADRQATVNSEADEHARRTSTNMLSVSRAMAGICAMGLAHHYPDMKFVSVESGAGWLLYLKESLDWHWRNFGAHELRPELELPSFYMQRQVYGTFWFEEESMRAALPSFGNNIMFETDFPHPTSLSPGPASWAIRPRTQFEKATQGCSDEQIRALAYGTAAKVYNIEVPLEVEVAV
jgi:predicted TIM-barrel fold metal-dependent hydrolase